MDFFSKIYQKPKNVSFLFAKIETDGHDVFIYGSAFKKMDQSNRFRCIPTMIVFHQNLRTDIAREYFSVSSLADTYTYDNDTDRVCRDSDWECPNHRPRVPLRDFLRFSRIWGPSCRRSCIYPRKHGSLGIGSDRCTSPPSPGPKWQEKQTRKGSSLLFSLK